MRLVRSVPLLFLCLAVAACGGRPDRGDVSGSAPDEITVMSANFDDRDPTDWPGRSPDRYPVHGIDVSRFQTSVDWQTARANGVNFAFIKATEGGDMVDPMFDSHWRAAGAAVSAIASWSCESRRLRTLLL